MSRIKAVFDVSSNRVSTVVYSSGAGIVLKVIQRHRRASLSTMPMHVDAILTFVWMQRYAASRSIFPININFYGYLMPMDATIWSILRRKKPQKYGWGMYFKTRLFINRPVDPGKYQSFVTRLFI